MKQLIVATHNIGKMVELFGMLSLPDIEVKCLKDFPSIGDIEETGMSLRENAYIKAYETFRHTELPSLGDDSGLEIHELGKYPGIYSARCAGENAGDFARMQHILNKAKDIKDRSAQFRCVICFVNGLRKVYFEGIVHGTIVTMPRGRPKKGLPFDAIFMPVGQDKTFAEMTQAEKNVISHRGKAIMKAKKWLVKNF